MADILEPKLTDDNIAERDSIELDPIDASDLVVDEIVLDVEDYEEIIVLDLRRPESHDVWYS